MSRSFLVALSFLLLAPLYTVVAYVSPGAPSGYVNDFTQTLSAGERSTLEATLAAFHASTTKEVAVAIVPSLGGDDIESYANTLFREWGIGDKERNDGVLLLVAMEEHQMRIEVGYGNEGTLTDARSSRIIRETMTPLFKAGKYGEGVTRGAGDILAVLVGDPSTLQTLDRPSSETKIERFLDQYFGQLFLFIFMGLSWITSILGRTKSWWLGGVFGAVAGGAVALFAGISAGVTAASILIPLGLLFDFVVSRGYKHSRASGATPPWWTGGSGFGGGSFGGGGFGGFGGGSSGGGGASGRW